MTPNTPKELFLLGALRRSHADEFRECWNEPIKLTRDYCVKYAECFDWYVMAFTFLDKNEFASFNDRWVPEANEAMFKARCISNPREYQAIWKTCQELLANAFFDLSSNQVKKPFYLRLWNWISS